MVHGEEVDRAEPVSTGGGVGRRRHGKEQLRIDEARRWQAKAIRIRRSGEGGAVAAMMCFSMGMRCSEVVNRVVRDLDDEGRLLWIPESKTLAGQRKLQVPEFLQPYLVRLAKGREPTAALFGQHWRDWPRKWVQRICRAAERSEGDRPCDAGPAQHPCGGAGDHLPRGGGRRSDTGRSRPRPKATPAGCDGGRPAATGARGDRPEENVLTEHLINRAAIVPR